jgi:hypothetical protein
LRRESTALSFLRMKNMTFYERMVAIMSCSKEEKLMMVEALKEVYDRFTRIAKEEKAIEDPSTWLQLSLYLRLGYYNGYILRMVSDNYVEVRWFDGMTDMSDSESVITLQLMNWQKTAKILIKAIECHRERKKLLSL